MHTILIIMHKNRVEFLVRDNISTYASGSDPLTSTNGDYDSALSNIVNLAYGLCKDKNNVDFIFRKE